MKFLHFIPIILVLCLIYSWLDFAKAIKNKSGLAKSGTVSLSVPSVGKKAKQTPIQKPKNPENTKSKVGVKKAAKKIGKNHNTEKLNVKTAKNSKLTMDVKYCKECCPSIAAVNRENIGQKREKNKRSKRMAGWCGIHGYYDCEMCDQDDMFSGADHQDVIEATRETPGTPSSAESAASSGGSVSSNDHSAESSSSSSSEIYDRCNYEYSEEELMNAECSTCTTEAGCERLSGRLYNEQYGTCEWENNGCVHYE